ncbi:hypothetical protein [Singulisphaera acidiphila]|uniref:Uncharacterized protein n=1 Tax=Singulisphaera acidiphila (strain ATCC BAA-1392 / DSM 18658 / VKM B-2454 / MOB10) TaxID=886293 RepID=L0DEF0_SINAD|nr:hypothetical protein [Singulisphaera acidiphila]AGA27754.1 hypothetical protein Sinac_3498 [Singulisphaera acidiphila DSM 18658]
MVDLRGLEERLVRNGRVDGQEIEVLRNTLAADGKLDLREADFLVELHKRVQQRTHAFEQFFYSTIKKYILMDGRIGPEKTEWLRRLVLQDDKIEDEEREFLRQLKGEAAEVSLEFEALFGECMKYPPEQRTSGG